MLGTFVNMNYLDIAIAIPLIWGIYKGFTKGLIIELSSIAGLIGGVYIGMHYSSITEQYLSTHLDIDESIMPIASFALTFVLVILFVFVVAKILEKIINLIALKLVNKIAGSFFGFIKAVFIVSLLLVLTESIDQRLNIIPQEMKLQSTLYSPVQSIAPTLIPAIKKLDLFEEILDSQKDELFNI